MSKIVELFGHNIPSVPQEQWKEIVEEQICVYTNTKCFKVRKSEPEISIGTCTVNYGKEKRDIIICPKRLLQKKQVFTDCVHLLTKHEPGNEFHVVSEVNIPGGCIDYFLVSARDNKVKGFVGIEFQTLDTTGTVYPERQRLLKSFGIDVAEKDVASKKKFGMNWKMTAKTILVQLHHKIDTFEHIGKHLVLIVQDCFFDYMKKEFNFSHLSKPSKLGDSMHIHSYSLRKESDYLKLNLSEILSTDSQGISTCLGLQAEAKVEFAEIIKSIEAKLSNNTLLTIV
ncbi:NotI family restriction endonuclease [Pleurocapsa sp. FMAR1]|uniref:NotI family restriction endonuclease n=1 Tax=Pleurocapsa sp. FMAR1 TaxID=3040204 RepID=UPI0029C897CC|nr:NotI family restriction endonuclease [Pleurocapsa sp. FMAR1]